MNAALSCAYVYHVKALRDAVRTWDAITPSVPRWVKLSKKVQFSKKFVKLIALFFCFLDQATILRPIPGDLQQYLPDQSDLPMCHQALQVSSHTYAYSKSKLKQINSPLKSYLVRIFFVKSISRRSSISRIFFYNLIFH